MIKDDVKLGSNVRIPHPQLVNLYGCSIGDETLIGPFVEITNGVSIGSRCKIQSHSFICTGVFIEDEVFIGHGVMFINDNDPRASNADGSLQTANDWHLHTIYIEKRASIGSNATILGGVRIGAEAMIGAGAVVTKDVPAKAVVVGNPAVLTRFLP